MADKTTWPQWRPWFAWYPVLAYDYAESGGRYGGNRFVWLRRVEWTEGHMIDEWLYRIPDPPSDRVR